MQDHCSDKSYRVSTLSDSYGIKAAHFHEGCRDSREIFHSDSQHSVLIGIKSTAFGGKK